MFGEIGQNFVGEILDGLEECFENGVKDVIGFLSFNMQNAFDYLQKTNSNPMTKMFGVNVNNNIMKVGLQAYQKYKEREYQIQIQALKYKNSSSLEESKTENQPFNNIQEQYLKKILYHQLQI